MILPDDFAAQMTQLLGASDYPHFLSALEKSPQMAFRPNISKGFQALGTLQSVPWFPSGFYLSQRPAFTFDPLFHAGAYYVQEPSSMFIGQAVKACGEVRCALDLCASPGGKSTLLRSLLPKGSLLVCNEPVKLRAQILLENMLKWGHPGVVVTNDFPHTFASLRGCFDLIAVDAPCSGEGMFRKDNPALEEWSLNNVESCANRQQDIVSEVWPALRNGGFLIYSTCTYNLQEDEENVKWFCDELGAEAVEIPLDDSWHVTGNLLPGAHFPVYRFLPHRTAGEGFFLALLRKKERGNSDDRIITRGRKTSLKFRSVASTSINAQLKNANDFVTITQDDLQSAFPCAELDRYIPLTKYLHILSAGIPLAVNKGNKLLPHQGLALSTELNKEAFPFVEVDRATALQYLRRMSLTLPDDTPHGYILITFGGMPLGFVNNLGSHANNLYPQNWKIRSSYTPDDGIPFLTQNPKLFLLQSTHTQ